MALQKTVTFKGVDSNYWKILEVKTSYIPGITYVKMGLYKDSTVREENSNNYLETKEYNFTDVTFTDADNRADLYALIKSEIEEFADATDV